MIRGLLLTTELFVSDILSIRHGVQAFCFFIWNMMFRIQYSHTLCPRLPLKSEYNVCALPKSYARTYTEHNSCKQKGRLLQSLYLYQSIGTSYWVLSQCSWQRILQLGHRVQLAALKLLSQFIRSETLCAALYLCSQLFPKLLVQRNTFYTHLFSTKCTFSTCNNK